MKSVLTLVLVFSLLFFSTNGFAQARHKEIDSLIILFKNARHDWNEYARQFIQIGEPAIPALVDLLENRSLSQWTRRIAAMTLNDMHSPLYIETALKILTDRSEDFTIRNQVTNGLKGHDLSYAREELWKIYTEESDQWFRSNIAHILVTSDTALAYRAYREIYQEVDGYVKQQALLSMVRLRPGESTSWFLKGLQTDDWMTANLAMDSLISTSFFIPGELVNLYKLPGTPEETRWRIVFVLGHRDIPESIPLLIEALRDPGWLVYNEAAVGLSRMKPEKVIPGMKELLKDPDSRVRSNARWVMNKLN
jgi:HEAT repeat protein